MNKFLIDANLPKLLRFWHDDACVFLPDDEWHDSRVWRYARENNLTIVTKDGDFEKLALAGSPPVVVLLCVGPASRQELWGHLAAVVAHRPLGQPAARLPIGTHLP